MKSFLIFFSVIFLTSCPSETGFLEVEKTLTIASKQIDCVGLIAQKCLLVKENDQQNWTNFYDSIIDFNYEEGFEYVILVLEREIENPAQDVSSIEFSLVKVISKTKKISENLPN